MALAVTIADAKDGTGGTATVSGSTAGTTNELYRAHFKGQDGPLVWESIGSRTGDGTIAVTTGPMRAYYLWYVKNTNGATVSVTAPVLQALTDARYTATRTRIVTAVSDKLKLLNLDGIGSEGVLILNSVDDYAQRWPAAIVIRDVTPDQYFGGTNLRDDLGYPVQVILQDQSGMGGNAPMAKWDLWRERSEWAFREQRLSGVSEVMTCTIEPALHAEQKPKVYEHAVSAFTVRVWSRELRGITA